MEWLHRLRLSCSVGFTLPHQTPELLALIPDHFWQLVCDAHDQIRDGVWVAELTAWLQMLAFTGRDARRWEPKRLRLRLFTIPATIARSGRRTLLHLAEKAPWADHAIEAIRRLRQLAAPT